MKLHFPSPSRLAYFLAAFTVLAAGTAKQAAAADIATTLAQDPQFSDFVTELRIIGLWPAIADANNVTIFAPTNAAFDNTRAAWKSQLMDALDTASTYGAKRSAYEAKLRGAVVMGTHPVGDFAGKAQLVHSLGSTVYWVDGRGNTIQVQDSPPNAGEMGMPPVQTKTAELSLPPIPTSNGLIYPINAVIR